MKYKLVTYRTRDFEFPQYAIIPDLYLSDLLDWLVLSGVREYAVSDNPHPGQAGLSDFRPPIGWPMADKCREYIRTFEMLATVGMGNYRT